MRADALYVFFRDTIDGEERIPLVVLQVKEFNMKKLGRHRELWAAAAPRHATGGELRGCATDCGAD